MTIWNPITTAPKALLPRTDGRKIIGVDAAGQVSETWNHHIAGRDGGVWVRPPALPLSTRPRIWEPVAWVHAYVPLPALPHDARVVHIEYDVDWLPLPNQVETILTATEAPEDLTRTAFMVPYCRDHSVVLANNRRRGVEMAGGHREGDETMLQGALRELREETGVAEVTRAQPLGYLRMHCGGDLPQDYAYPFPLSYQQVYTGYAESVPHFTPTDECVQPVLIRRGWTFVAPTRSAQAFLDGAFEAARAENP